MKKFIFLFTLFALVINFWLLVGYNHISLKLNIYDRYKNNTAQGDKLYNRINKSEWLGVASWYGPGFHLKKRADGGIYDMYKISVAHKYLPFGTKLHIVNLDNMKTVKAVVNDRGPYIEGRDIDLSYKAAKILGAVKPGLIPVKIRIIS